MPTFERYLKFLKYINGIPADPPVYRLGEKVDEKEYASKEDCELSVLYRWVELEGLTICKDYNKYNKELKEISKDKGLTWLKLDEFRAGSVLIEEHSRDCGWKAMYRWEPTGVIKCDGMAKTQEQVYQESLDVGKTWQNVVPEQYKYKVLEEFSLECAVKSEPIIYEVTGKNVTIDLEMINLTHNPETEQFNTIFWVLWGEDEPIVKHESDVLNIKIEDWYTEEKISALMVNKYPLPPHEFTKDGKHIVKIWGVAGRIGEANVPYSILSWGTPYTIEYKYSYTNKPYHGTEHTYRGYHTNNHGNEVKLGENLRSLPTNNKQGLKYNSKFSILNNKFITSIPTYTLEESCKELDLSGCTKITKVVGEGAKVLSKAKFTDCISLLEVPRFPRYEKPIEWDFNNYTYKDGIYSDDSYKGCTALKHLDNRILYITGGKRMFLGSGLETMLNTQIIQSRARDQFTWECYSMFLDCKSLVDTSGSTLHVANAYDSFINCINLKNIPTVLLPKDCLYSEYASRVSMFANSGVESVQASKIFNCFAQYNGIFKNCKALKTVEGSVSFNPSGSYKKPNLEEMRFYGISLESAFESSGVQSIGNLLQNLTKGSINCDYMFKDCKQLTTISNNFIYSGVDPNIKAYLYFKEVFAGCSNLTNYPVLEDIPIWMFPTFYFEALIHTTNAFLGCDKIIREIPPEWGGIKVDNPEDLVKFTIKTTTPDENVDFYREANNVDGFAILNCDFNKDANNLIYIKTPGEYEVLLLVLPESSTSYNFPAQTVKISSTGNLFSMKYYQNCTYIKEGYNLWSTTTNLNNVLKDCNKLTDISPTIFSHCKNVTLMLHPFTGCSLSENKLTEIMLYITTLTSAAGMFEKDVFTTTFGVFENNPNILDASRACYLMTRLRYLPTKMGKKITNFNSCFYNCSSVRGDTPKEADKVELWLRKYFSPEYAIPTDFNHCFYGCTKLDNYAEIPHAWKNP